MLYLSGAFQSSLLINGHGSWTTNHPMSCHKTAGRGRTLHHYAARWIHPSLWSQLCLLLGSDFQDQWFQIKQRHTSKRCVWEGALLWMHVGHACVRVCMYTSRPQQIRLFQSTVDIYLKLSVQTPQSGHLLRLQWAKKKIENTANVIQWTSLRLHKLTSTNQQDNLNY